jgi:hypothetical protein
MITETATESDPLSSKGRFSSRSLYRSSNDSENDKEKYGGNI